MTPSRMRLYQQPEVLRVFGFIFILFNHIRDAAEISETRSFPNRISIGALLEERSITKTVFRYEIGKHNNSTSNLFLVDPYYKYIDAADSYNISKTICDTLSSGIFAIFGITNRTSYRTVSAFIREFNMPYITPSEPVVQNGASQPTETPFLLYLRPSVLQPMIDVIKFFKWKHVYYLYDSLEGLSRLQMMTSKLSLDYNMISILPVRVSNIETSHVVLRQTDAKRSSGNKYFILDISSHSDLQDILYQIQNVGMNRINYHYLIASLAVEELDIADFKHGGANITGFRLVSPRNPQSKRILSEWMRLNSKDWDGIGSEKSISLSAALTTDAIQVILKGLRDVWSKNSTIFTVHNWRRKTTPGKCSPWVHGATVMKSLLSVQLDGLTGPISFDKNGYRKSCSLDIMFLQLDNELRRIGTWNSESGLEVDVSKLGLAISAPLPINRTRVITTIESEPYLMKKKKPDDGTELVGNDRYEGYCVDLAEELAKEIGFEYEIRLVKDETYGEKQPDGTWNGMVGELTRHEADIAVAPLTITSMRERVIDFSKPFMSLGISIMIKKPEKQKPGVFSFMDPLDLKIWMCIVFSYLTVSMVLFLVSRFSPNEWQIEDSVHGPTFTNDFTISNSMWFSLGAFMRRGCDVCPRSLAGRIVGSVWWFFTLIIISSYTANLAAFLTIERMLTPIESADDLSKQTEISYGTVDGGSTKDFFKTSKIPTYMRMWSYMNNNQHVFMKTTGEGVKKVQTAKGKYAFLIESTMNDYYNQRKPCNTMKVGENLDSKGYGIATYINSDLREKINVEVLNLRETEKLQKFQKKWWYDKGECVVESDKKGGSSQSSLSLSNVAGVFYILISGLGFAMIVASVEFYYKSRVEANRQRKRYLEKTRHQGQCYRATSSGENGGYTAPSGVSKTNTSFDTGIANTQV